MKFAFPLLAAFLALPIGWHLHASATPDHRPAPRDASHEPPSVRQDTRGGAGDLFAPDAGVSRPRLPSDAGADDYALRIDLARACYIEAAGNARDCLAQLWVLKKRADRAGVTLTDMVWRYTALKSRKPRPMAIKRMTWDELPEGVRETVVAFLAGETRDPFPKADHWGGTCDTVGANEVLIGVRANRFFRRARR